MPRKTDRDGKAGDRENPLEALNTVAAGERSIQ